MANNGYHSDSKQTLWADDLKVGQTLIHLVYPRWGGGEVGLREHKVARITKTRLILTRGNGETRVIVRRRDQFDAKGEVTRRYEGMSDWAESFILATEDDGLVKEARERNANRAEVGAAKRAIDDAAKDLTRETAAAAIIALRSYLDSNA